jgi:hypothetical protein
MDAKTLTILFSGLIAQVQLPNSTLSTAVLPNDGAHDAVLSFQAAQIVGPPPTDEFFPPPKNGEYTIHLKRMHVEISGLAAGETDGSAVHDLIPSLTKIASCKKLRTEVKKRTPTERLGAFVDYSGGELMPRSYFTRMAYVESVTGWDVPRCFPCWIQLVTPLLDDNMTLIFIAEGKRHSVVLHGDAEISVTNLYPPHARQHKPKSHFENFYSIFSDSCEHQKIIAAEPCQRSDQLCMLEEPDPDCTNSHYP